MRTRWLVLLAVLLTACSANSGVLASLAIGDAPSTPAAIALPLDPVAVSSLSPSPAASALPSEAPAEVGVLVAQGPAQAVRIVDVRSGRMLAAKPAPVWLGPSMPHVSRDGHYMVYATQTDHGGQLVLWDLQANAEVPLARFSDKDAREPDLDADGNVLVYVTGGPFLQQLAVFDRRQGLEHVLAIPRALCIGAREPTISGDGRVAAYVTDSARGDADIVVVDVATGRPITAPQLNTLYDETEPALSADGHTLLFVSNRAGSKDVFALDLTTDTYLNTSALNSFADEDWPRFVGPRDDTIAYYTAASGTPALMALHFSGR